MKSRYRRSLAGAAIAGAAVLALSLSACGSSSNPLGKSGGGSTGSAGTLVVGSANFPESEIIAEIYAGALKASGVNVTTKLSIGTREAYVKAVKDGSIDIVPDYSGSLLQYIDPSATAASTSDILTQLKAKLPSDLKVLAPSKAEDKDALVVTQAIAKKYSLKSLVDLGKVCSQITIGAPPEFKNRPYGAKGLKDKYNCVPKSFQPINDGGGPATLKALLDNKVQAADIFTTSPSIPDNHLVVLADPKNNFIAQQVLPLVRAGKVDSKAAAALNKVSAVLTTNDLINLNREVSGSAKMDPKTAADKWLKSKGLG